jgi:hypothetical protein
MDFAKEDEPGVGGDGKRFFGEAVIIEVHGYVDTLESD